jgi:hypothetical protein
MYWIDYLVLYGIFRAFLNISFSSLTNKAYRFFRSFKAYKHEFFNRRK